MTTWTRFPYDDAGYTYDAASLRQRWGRLHAGDAEPMPRLDAVLQAWASFHAGDFQAAVDSGLKAGGAGVTVANKAQCVYAAYLEQNEQRKLELLLEAAERADAQRTQAPDNANAHYWYAYALGRYGQSVSVAQTLEQGLAARVREALETTIRLAPSHADAHIALGVFHAEVIDKVGGLLGKTQGASKDAALESFTKGLRLNPASAIARIEYAHALLVLEGEQEMDRADVLYQEAARCEALDAAERLHLEIAKAALEA